MGPARTLPHAQPAQSPPAGEVGVHAILYDRECGFCKWSLAQVLRWDRSRRLRPVPIQGDEGGALLAGMDEARRLGSWHLVAPDGTVTSAGAAAAPLARLLPGGRPLAAAFRAFPRATERAYRWIADHRGTLGRLVRADAGRELPR